MDKLDRYILDIVEKKISEPPKYEESIKKALNNTKKSSKLNAIFKKVAVIILCISAVGGIAFAVQMSGIINKVNNKSNEYNIAYNEYIQKVNMEYQTVDNLSIKIDSILLDKFNIEINIDYLYNKSITSAESKILITDENNNLIYKSTEVIDYYEQIFKKIDRNEFVSSMKSETSVSDDNMVNDENKTENMYTTRVTNSYQNLETNNLLRKIELYNDLDFKEFPESKILYIQLENIILKDGSKKVKELNCKWNFEVKIDNEFLKEEVSSYKEEKNNKNDKLINVIQAKSSNVLLKIKFNYAGQQKLDEIIDLLDSDCIQLFDKKNNYYIKSKNISILDNNIIKADFDINKKDLSDILIIKIKNFEDIKIISEK